MRAVSGRTSHVAEIVSRIPTLSPKALTLRTGGPCEAKGLRAAAYLGRRSRATEFSKRCVPVASVAFPVASPRVAFPVAYRVPSPKSVLTGTFQSLGRAVWSKRLACLTRLLPGRQTVPHQPAAYRPAALRPRAIH